MATPRKKRKVRAALKEDATSPISKYFRPAASSSRLKSCPGPVVNKIDTPNVVDITKSPPSHAATGLESNISAPKTPPTSSQRASRIASLVDSPDVFDVRTPTLPQHVKPRSLDQKPITPSSTMKSSMNNSLVFDIVTSLSTNDPDVAASALRSVVALAKEYPTPLLFEELLDLMHNESTYARAVAIFNSMIFVYEHAAQCNTTMAFPAQWTRMHDTLCDVALKPMDAKWLRSLLVLQFMVHYFAKDMTMCEERFAATNKDWIAQTRLHFLLGGRSTEDVKATKKGRVVVQNNVILAALGRIVELWVRVYDASDSQVSVDGREGCVAAMRLLEMLLHVTDQKDNAMQKILTGLHAMQRPTRRIFLQTMRTGSYKMMLATTVLGRTTLSRCKELEWFGCIAQEACVARALHPSAQKESASAGGDAECRRFAAIHLKTYEAKQSTPPPVHALVQHILRLQNSRRK
ncbi:hypothetical protein, variant [Aphanomyces invadans]|uniref:Uncharacterized protein n=1 Tax=Aphanomyces invadans TaxID=157072 RepID=A0A024TAG6_9STRA|nr:hypothetical protein, variant [Aphanomyces invadans]ETV90979.1 hypothetical protein, variant [Aphanomyces invadans]|eukprot:XP_008880368.1 hypothetical protein, variant [Aphanomyces invadans]